jgi:hypothetical protein
MKCIVERANVSGKETISPTLGINVICTPIRLELVVLPYSGRFPVPSTCVESR